MLKSLAARSLEALRSVIELAEAGVPLPLLMVPLGLVVLVLFTLGGAAAAATAGGYRGSRFHILAVWSAEQVARCLTSGESKTRVR